MKAIVKIGIIPVFAVAMLGFTGFPIEGKQGKGHGQQNHGGGGNGNGGGNEDKQQGGGSSHGNGGGKGNSSHSQSGENSQPHGNGNGGGKSQGNKNPQGNTDKGNSGHGNANKAEHGNSDHGNNGHDNKDRGNSVAGKAEHGNMHGNQGNVAKDRNGKGKRYQERIENWDGNIDWGFNNYPDRRRPNNGKKVTICHRTSGEYPVEINVSEHAAQAHMNHGDNMGGCNINYSNAWTPRYIDARQNVYNTYEQTWETMSYSEALLRFAAEKLLGIRSNLDQNRRTLTSQQIQQREAYIYELENNINALEQQRALTSQRLGGINININL